MKTVFDKTTRDEVINRIQSLTPNSHAQWGKMNVYQMTKHGIIWDEWVLGINKPVYKQGLLGLIFGKIALKSNVKDDRPIQKNMPAGRGFTVKEKTGDLELQKKIWAERIAAYASYSNPAFIHNFFGKMTLEQIGQFAYKHTDHHLRQFNV
jgi:hypothetical protein